MSPLRSLIRIAPALLALCLTACSRDAEHAHDHDHHHHEAPHGGTVAVLGDEQYHLEFVHDAEAGKLTAYILDGEMETFVRLVQPSFELVAMPAEGAPRLLVFQAVANSATGETVGNSSQYEATAEWLKDTAEFEATIGVLTIKGNTFEKISFPFPEGNEHHHHHH